MIMMEVLGGWSGWKLGVEIVCLVGVGGWYLGVLVEGMLYNV